MNVGDIAEMLDEHNLGDLSEGLMQALAQTSEHVSDSVIGKLNEQVAALAKLIPSVDETIKPQVNILAN